MNKIFQDISRYFKIFQDISRYFKIFQDISRYFKIFQDISRYFESFTSNLRSSAKRRVPFQPPNINMASFDAIRARVRVRCLIEGIHVC